MTRVDFHAVNARGVVLFTSSDIDIARSWVRVRAAEHDDLHVEEVVTMVQRRTVYRPRKATGTVVQLSSRSAA